VLSRWVGRRLRSLANRPFLLCVYRLKPGDVVSQTIINHYDFFDPLANEAIARVGLGAQEEAVHQSLQYLELLEYSSTPGAWAHWFLVGHLIFAFLIAPRA
jgi:hypothetical protein